jgi:hypothetical protein
MSVHAHRAPLAGTARESVRRALASSPELRRLVAAAGSYAEVAFDQERSSPVAQQTLEARRQEFVALLHQVEATQRN